MPFGLVIDVVGTRRAIRKLDKLPSNLRRKGLRQGVMAAAGVLKKSVKSHAPRETGILKSSFRVARVKSRDKSIAVRVQPKSQKFATVNVKGRRVSRRRKLTGALRRKIAGQGLGRTFRNPARYAHLVELGHAAPGRGSRGGGRLRRLTRRLSNKSTPPHPFMKPAFRSSRRLALRAVSARVKKFLEMQKP